MNRMITGTAAALLLTMQLCGIARAEMPAEQKAEIEQLVRDYIIAHPEVIEEALVALEDKRREAEKAKQTQAIAALGKTIFDSEHQAVMGNPEGGVTMVEFFDYNCGYCKRAYTDLQALVESNPDLRVVMKEFPILTEGSLEAARISVAVSRLVPDKYPDFHRELLVSGGAANHEKAISVAQALGLDTKALETEAAREDVLQNFTEVRMLAQELGITGTPSYVIGNEAVFGAVGYDQLLEKIEQAKN